MKRRLLAALAVLLGLGVAGALVTLALLKHGLVVRIPEATIRAAVAKEFPLTRTHLLVLSVRYHDPVVDLDGGSDRVRVGISATPQIVVNSREWTGTILVDAGFRYDPASGQCFLTGFKLIRARIEGLPEAKHLEVANRAIAMFEERFAAIPVYTLDDADFKQRTAKALVKGIHVSGGAVVITLGL